MATLRLCKDDTAGLPDWVLGIPLSGEALKWNARTVTTLRWTMREAVPNTMKREDGPDLLFPSPWQDYMDRPERVVGMFSTCGAGFGISRALSSSRHFVGTGFYSRPRLLAGATIAMVLKWGGSFMVLGFALLTGDRIVHNLKRRLAAKQGIELADNEDVTRTPLHYAVGGSCLASCYTLVDTMRPTNVYRNFAAWAGGGLLVGYMMGKLKCNLLLSLERDARDEAAVAALQKKLTS
ncbi:hypothetical protein DIPPA_27879 [Diplonema papillatum]|nr:hypothetical protein DIPPA_27879 [Diplonema papillatum]